MESSVLFYDPITVLLFYALHVWIL